jgi:signal transduction histidine kinase
MSRRIFAEITLSILTFAWVLGLTIFHLFIRPYPGFLVASTRGEITETYQAVSETAPLRVGDRILKIDEVVFEKSPAHWDFTPPLFWGYRPGDIMNLTIERGGRVMTIEQPFLGPTRAELIGRLNSRWLIPIFFWLAGAMTLLFIRPRTQLSWLMATFFHLTAFWVSAGMVSQGHVVWAAMAMRVIVWLCIPVYLHFLWLFPVSLGRPGKIVVPLLYGLGIGMAMLQMLELIPSSLYLVGFAICLAGCLVLIILHAIYQRTERRTLAGLLGAAVIILVPIAITSLASSFTSSTYLSTVTVTGFSALPGYFFLTIFRRQIKGQDRRVNTILSVYLAAILVEIAIAFLPVAILDLSIRIDYTLSVWLSTLFTATTMLIGFTPFLILPALAHAEVYLPSQSERPVVIRANRLAGDAFFFLILLFLALLLMLGVRMIVSTVWHEVILATCGFLLVILASLTRNPFQAWFQEKVLGMPLHPDQLANHFSGRILSSLDASGLRALLIDEILPSLLIRQSALVSLPPRPLPFLTLRVTPEQIPGADQAFHLAERDARLLKAEDLPKGLEWIRLAIPLRVGKQLIGLWMFGARDPDDQYDSTDIDLIRALAAQTALALSHIDQADQLRAIYRSDVDQRDAERQDFARELHDAVLNPLAVLTTTAEPIPPHFLAVLEDTIQHVRRVVKGLRPEMLSYGLHFGLQTLVDDLQESIPAGGPQIILEIPDSEARLDQRVEFNLFRIVQQACENAIRHAGARRIRLTGSITEEKVTLIVSDNGKGFAFTGRMDLAELLAGKHYGLAGMHERAGSIGAEMNIHSRLGSGTTVEVIWLDRSSFGDGADPSEKSAVLQMGD